MIKKITKEKDCIKIVWKDYQISKFHYLWLRDNCPSNEHPIARQKIFNISDVSSNIYPKDFFINKDKKLEIIWSEKNHISYFDIKWLKKNCYSINNKEKNLSTYKTWDSKFINRLNNFKIQYKDIIKNDKALTKWLENLIIYGFTIIINAPIKKNSGFNILKRISHIRDTFFKTPFEVINITKPNNAAYTSQKLFSHTDLPYFEYTPGYQFLHCLSNEAKGGDSSIVDGYAVANYIKKNDPKTYNLLTKIPVKFKDNDYTQDKIRIINSPIITLKDNKEYKDIKFNMSAIGTIVAKPNKMQRFYLAYRKFSSLVHSNKFSVKLRLKKGDIMSFNNRRILHGRTSFEPSSGHRHLQGYYMDHDEILARLNALKKIEI